jgi:putative transcriptional regulator
MSKLAGEPGPGTLLVAPASEDSDDLFARSVVLVFDREPNGIVAGLVINRPLEQRALESSALALLFVPEPNALAFWGGPIGDDPLILAQFSALDGLDYYHLPIRRRRSFVLADVGVVAVAEHADAFDGRICRARLYVGMCVWGRGQLEAEIGRGAWRPAVPRADDLFTPDPAGLWARLDRQAHDR